MRKINLWTLLFVILQSAILVGCGSTSSSKLKIRNGVPIDFVNAPDIAKSTVGLIVGAGGNTGTCSGTLIGARLVLTAAHCLTSNAIQVYLGSDFRRSDSGILIAARRSRYPDTYNLYTNSRSIQPNDIAIVELADRAPYPYEPMPLWEEELEPGDTVFLAGFGRDGNGFRTGLLQGTSSVLQEIDSEGRYIVKGINQEGACSGDSGGPLFTVQDGKWYVAGALSGGPVPCIGLNIYTSTYSERGFLEETIDSLTQY